MTITQNKWNVTALRDILKNSAAENASVTPGGVL